MKFAHALAILASGCSFGTLAAAQTVPAESTAPEGQETTSNNPQAPDTDPAGMSSPNAEEIIVTGVRAAIQRATAIKRNADTIADAISAEDIGKFPDANIADSLQRITGVQISRTSGGEGRFVSIRGLGSQFNLTTFNGRVLATDNAGRDFSYDIMPSEAIAAATVFKAPTASLIDGSIGGLVELTTLDPLSRPGFHISGSAGGLYDEASKKVTPRLGFVASDTFADNTLGVFGGVYWYKRNWRSDTYQSFGASTETVDSNGDGVRDQAVDGRGAFPGIISYQVKNGPRERLSLVGGVQYAPTDRLKTKIDAFYSYYDTPENNYSYNVNFYSNDGWARFANAQLEPWAGDATNRYLITSFDLTNIPVEIGTDTHARKVTTYQVGWNTAYEATDALTIKLDLAYSQAKRPNAGKEFFTVAGVKGGTYRFEATSPVPTVMCTLPDGRSCLDLNNDEIGLHFMEQKGEQTKDKALSSRLDFDYKFGLGGLETTFKVGGFYFNRIKDKLNYAPTNGCGYCGFNDTLGSVGVVAVVPFPSGGYRAGTIGGANRWPALNAEALFRAAVLSRGQAYFDENIAAKPQLRSSSKVDEDQYGGYAQLNFNADRWDGNIGVRYIRTRAKSSGHSQQLLALEPIPDSTNFKGTFSEVIPISETNTYNNFLPSANITYRLLDNLQVRAAASKAITRPTFAQLGVDVNWEINSLPPRVSRNGNPQLKAIKADSLDLSVEWYGNQGSSASVAAFYKKIKGFITGAVIQEEIIGETFQVSVPVNGDTAELKGIEAGLQHIFSNGLGGLVNYTYVDSKADVTIKGVQTTTSLDGVSKHTVNASGFYEKGPLSLRLSYAFRDAYVACAVCGPASTPTTTAASGFMDFSGSFAFTDNFTLYLDVYNITEEDTHSYVLDKRFTTFYEPYSRRFEFGVRAKF